MKQNIQIATKIKNKFQLFTGLRDVNEDEKILHKVSELSFYEVLAFLEENEPELTSQTASRYLENKRFDKALETILNKLESNKQLNLRLEKRIDYFLNNLLYQTLNN